MSKNFIFKSNSSLPVNNGGSLVYSPAWSGNIVSSDLSSTTGNMVNLISHRLDDERYYDGDFRSDKDIYLFTSGNILSDSLVTFTRNQITTDYEGNSLGVNEPRFDSSKTIGYYNESGTNIWESTSAGINFGGGYDKDGVTPIGCIIEDSTNKIYIISGVEATEIYEESFAAYSFDMMKGGVSNRKYLPRQPLVVHGCIVILCEVRATPDDGTQYKGVGIVYSNDYGTTWDNRALTEYPDANTQHGTNFCLQNFYSVDDEALTVWLALTDYHFQSSADHYSMGLLKLSRSAFGDDYTVGAIREMVGNTGVAIHSHSAGAFWNIDENIVGIVGSIGDGTDDSRIVLAWTEYNDYENATISENQIAHGVGVEQIGASVGTTLGSQFTSIAPGSVAGEHLVGTDVQNFIVAKITTPHTLTTGDLASYKIEVDRVYGNIPNVGSLNPENFHVICRDCIGRTDYVAGVNEVGYGVTKLYSADGNNWTHWKLDPDSQAPKLGWYGDKMIHAVGSAGLVAYDKPTTTTFKPIVVGPGVHNRAKNWSQWTAPSAGNTCTSYTTGVGGLYYYPDDNAKSGELLNSQPLTMTEVRRVTNTGVAGSECGRWYLDSLDSTTTVSGSCSYGIYPLVDGVRGELFLGSTSQFIKAISPVNDWSYFTRPNEYIKHGTSKPAVRIYNRDGYAVKQDWLVTCISHHTGVNVANGYPVSGRVDASNDPEILSRQESLEDDFSLRVILGPTDAGAALPPLPLFTIWHSSGNYTEVEYNNNSGILLNVSNGGSITSGMVTDSNFIFSLKNDLVDRYGTFLVSQTESSTELRVKTFGSTVRQVTVNSTLPTFTGNAELRYSNPEQTIVAPMWIGQRSIADGLNDTQRATMINGIV